MNIERMQLLVNNISLQQSVVYAMPRLSCLAQYGEYIPTYTNFRREGNFAGERGGGVMVSICWKKRMFIKITHVWEVCLFILFSGSLTKLNFYAIFVVQQESSWHILIHLWYILVHWEDVSVVDTSFYVA